MDLEDKIDALENAINYMELAEIELKYVFNEYAEAISDFIGDLKIELEPLQEEQNEMWEEEMAMANREYERSRL